MVVSEVGDELPEAVVLPSGSGSPRSDQAPTDSASEQGEQVPRNQDQPTVELSAAGSADAPTRTDVRSDDETVVTQPFTETDEPGRDEPTAAENRRTAEHLTEDPLPYIEPQQTLILDRGEPVPPIADEPPPAPHYDEPDEEPAALDPRRGTLDLGLLVIRVIIGLVFTLHGLQKLTGWWGGPGVDGFAAFLANADAPDLGFTSDATTTLAYVAGFSETIGGILLILGLLAPIAGSAVLGVILVAAAYKATLAGGVWFFTPDGNGSGLEFELTLALVAAGLILTGPGRYSFDRRWGWSHRPAWGSFLWLLVGIGGAAAIWFIFNGANPFATR